MAYRSVVLGGTFDRLHTGHHALLQKAFSVGRKVTIGLTTDTYVNRIKNSHFVRHSRTSSFAKASEDKSADRQKSTIASHQIRKHRLEHWLNDQGWNGRYAITPLDDSYGPVINRETDFDAIVVSSETRKTAEKINALRTEKGLRELTIIEVPMVPAQDLRTVSSTRVRKGDIDASGRLILPDSLRPELKKSIGIFIPEKDLGKELKKDAGNRVITVGDMTTKKVLDLGVKPHLAIIDFQMERKPFLWEKGAFDRLIAKSTVRNLNSGPGYISRGAMQAIQDTFQSPAFHGKSTVLLIDGEEDLLVLPVLIEAPIGSAVYYGQSAIALSDSEMLAGQPNEGVIRVGVTEEKKRMAKALLQKFLRN